MWLLPSPARATRACPLPGQGEGSEMDTETQSEKITNSENDSLLAESYLRGNNTSGSPARNYDPSSFISSAEKLDHVRAQVGSRKSLLEALHDSRHRGDPIHSLQNLGRAVRQLHHSFGIQQHVSVLRGLPLQAESRRNYRHVFWSKIYPFSHDQDLLLKLHCLGDDPQYMTHTLLAKAFWNPGWSLRKRG